MCLNAVYVSFCLHSITHIPLLAKKIYCLFILPVRQFELFSPFFSFCTFYNLNSFFRHNAAAVSALCIYIYVCSLLHTLGKNKHNLIFCQNISDDLNCLSFSIVQIKTKTIEQKIWRIWRMQLKRFLFFFFITLWLCCRCICPQVDSWTTNKAIILGLINWILYY